MKKSEHALALIKAGISAVPYIGGPIASLIGDYVPTATQRSIETAITLLQEQLEALKDRIDPNSVNKDEFSELFKSCYLIIVRTHQKTKLRAVTALILNLLLKDGDTDKLSYTELDHFVRCVDNLSSGAIEVLTHSYKMAGRPGRPEAPGVGSENYRFDFQSLHNRMPDTMEPLLMGLVSELNSMNLVHIVGTPGVRTPDYGNYPIELTPLGTRFVVHILKISEQETNSKLKN